MSPYNNQPVHIILIKVGMPKLYFNINFFTKFKFANNFLLFI